MRNHLVKLCPKIMGGGGGGGGGGGLQPPEPHPLPRHCIALFKGKVIIQ